MCEHAAKIVWLFCRYETTININLNKTQFPIEMISGVGHWPKFAKIAQVFAMNYGNCWLNFQNRVFFNHINPIIPSASVLRFFFFFSFYLHHFSITNFPIENCSRGFITCAIVSFLKHVIHMFNQQMEKTLARVSRIAFSSPSCSTYVITKRKRIDRSANKITTVCVYWMSWTNFMANSWYRNKSAR